MFRTCFTAVLLASMHSMPVAHASVQVNGLPDELLTGLQGLSQLVSPLQVEWTHSRKSNVPEKQLCKLLGFPEDDGSTLETTFAKAEFDDGKVRTRIDMPVSTYDENNVFQRVIRDVLSFSYDGKVLYNWSGEGRDLDNSILFRDTFESLTRNNNPVAVMFRTPLFRYCGLQLPNTIGDIRLMNGSKVLAMLERGDVSLRKCEFDGRLWIVELAVDGTGEEHHFWINPEWNFLAERFAFIPGPNQPRALHEESLCSDFRKILNSDFGFPRSVVVSMRKRPSGQILFQDIYTIGRITQNPVDSDRFQITDNRPGVSIADGTLEESRTRPDGRIHYVVPADPDDLDKVIEAAERGEVYNPLMSDGHRMTTNRLVLIVVNIIVVTILIYLCIAKARTSAT